MKYKAINGFTKQSIIETIKKGNNNSQAKNNKNGLCEYLTTDGNRCFVGCFLPEGHSAQNYRGQVPDLFTEYSALVDLMPLDEEGLTELQVLHDTYQRTQASATLHETMEAWVNENVGD